MIQTEVINSIRISTCAVLRMPVKHEDALSEAIAKEKKVKRPAMDVVGTAFLVADGLMLTNRHVVLPIFKEHQETGSHDHWYVEFTHPENRRGWTQTLKRIDNCLAFTSPGGGGSLDVGFLSITGEPSELGFCKPVEFGDLRNITVGNAVGICGFPLGTQLLTNPELGIDRFGPLFHQGMVSAVAPYGTVDERLIEMFLTDVNSAGGMSGSPVFIRDTGRVIGLHFAGAERTVGCAIPIDGPRVHSWIDLYQRMLKDPLVMNKIMITAGGDLLEKESAS